MVRDLAGTQSQVVRLHDNAVVAVYAPDAPDRTRAVRDPDTAQHHRHRPARLLLHPGAHLLQLRVPLRPGQNAQRPRRRAVFKAQIPAAYFFEP